MPEKYIIKDGAIRDLADDYGDLQDVLNNNLQTAVALFVERPGLLFENPSHFGITVAAESITCSNINKMIFGNNICVTPSETEMSITSGFLPLDTSNTYYLYFSLIEVGSDPGTYEEGYPEGDTENTTITYDVELHLLSELKESETLLRICSLSYIEDAWVANYDGVALRLRESQKKTGLPAPENITYTNIFQRDLINSVGANVVSPATNLSLSGLFLKIEWDALYSNRDIYGYEIQLTPYRGDEPAVNFAETKIIPAQRSESTHCTHMEVCEGVYYKMEMRAIGQGFAPGEWSSPALLLAGSNGETPAMPSISIIEEVGPTVLHITTSTPNPPNTPHFIQIFKNEKVIYEGAPGIHSHMLLPEDESVTIKARVVAGGGVCSEFATCADIFSASSFDAILAAPMGMLAIPIDFSIEHDDHVYSENTLACESTVPSDGDDIKVNIGDYQEFFSEGFYTREEPLTAVVSNSTAPAAVPNESYIISKITDEDDDWHVYFEDQGTGTTGSGTCDLEIYAPVGPLDERISTVSIPEGIRITKMSFVSRACSVIDGAIENLRIGVNRGARDTLYFLTLSGDRPGLYVGSSPNPYDTDDCMHIYNTTIDDGETLFRSTDCWIAADYYGGTLNINGTLFLYYEKVDD